MISRNYDEHLEYRRGLQKIEFVGLGVNVMLRILEATAGYGVGISRNCPDSEIKAPKYEGNSSSGGQTKTI